MAIAPPGTSPDAAGIAALDARARVHGLAVLMLDGQVPRDGRLIDALVDPDG